MTNIKSVILKLSVLTIQWILVYSASVIPALPHPYHRYSSVSSLPQPYQHYLIRIIITHLYHHCLNHTSITSSVSSLLICIITASIIPALPHPYHCYSSVSSLPQSYQHYLIHIIVRISPFRHCARLGRSLFSQLFCLMLFFLLVFRLFNLCYLCRERDKDRESARHLKLGKLFNSCKHKYLYTVNTNICTLSTQISVHCQHKYLYTVNTNICTLSTQISVHCQHKYLYTVNTNICTVNTNIRTVHCLP